MAFFDGLFDRIDRSGKGLIDRMERFIDDVILLPDDVRAALEAGESALEQERFEIAEARFLEVLASKPQLGRAALGLAHARNGLGDVPGTLSALEEARALAPQDPELALWQARLALEAGDIALARSSATQASQGLAASRGEAFADACATLAWAEWHGGRPDRAARELRKALSVHDRTDLRVALVAALVDSTEVAAASAAAGTLKPVELEPAQAWQVGEALLRAGDVKHAQPFLVRASDGGEAKALVALGRATLRLGDASAARAQAQQAVAGGGGAPALRLLADTLTAEGDNAAAAEALEGAAQMVASEGDTEELRSLWAAALRVVPVHATESLSRYVDAFEQACPDVQGSQILVAARLFLGEPLPMVDANTIEEPRLALAQAVRAAEGENYRDAIRYLDAFAHCLDAQTTTDEDRQRAESLRRDAMRAAWHADGEVDLAAAIDSAADFGTRRGMDEVARGALRLRDELDRPLLLGVLGEFNAGKSTFVNALIGADVAPMGIVPTTATLNVLRSGAERIVRVVFRDGHTREGSYETMGPMLKELGAVGGGAKGADAIDQVEILMPSPQLERVWILDSPGTNALDAEHERLAKEAARRADAVLWIFDAAQAGKLTETEMHEELRAQGRVVVPVLNKCDRLREGELEDVSAVIRQGFGAPPIPLSAKQALKARLGEDVQALEASGFTALLAALETRIFSRSRQLKRQACAGRLSKLLDDALVVERDRAAARQRDVAGLAESRARLTKKRGEVLLAVDDALRSFSREVDEAFAAAADEVLAFARPRSSRFADRGVHAEDRAFLREVIGRRIREATGRCETRLRAQARGALDGCFPEDRNAADEVRSAFVAAFARFGGYQEGRLDGGALERFFDVELGRAEVPKEQVVHALAAVRVDDRRWLRPALREAADGLMARLDQDFERAEREMQKKERTLHAEVLAPLEALREVVGEIAALPSLNPDADGPEPTTPTESPTEPPTQPSTTPIETPIETPTEAPTQPPPTKPDQG